MKYHELIDLITKLNEPRTDVAKMQLFELVLRKLLEERVSEELRKM
jgi:hypothetical protein